VLLVVAGGEVVLTQVGEYFAGAEQVPDGVEQAVSDRDGGLVRAPAAGYLPVLGGEVAALVRAAARADSIRVRRSHWSPGVVATRRRLPADS